MGVPMRFAQEAGKVKQSQCVRCYNRKEMPGNMDSKCSKFGKCLDKYRLVSKNKRCPYYTANITDNE